MAVGITPAAMPFVVRNGGRAWPAQRVDYKHRWRAAAAAPVLEAVMMRFNHMELTLPIGTLTPELRKDIDAFYGGVFGWEGRDTKVVNQDCHLLRLDEYTNQFILLAEYKNPLSSPGYDHLGLLQDTREEVDELLAKCKEFQQKDDRVRIKEYEDLVNPTVTVHAFYVKYLLPIWFDVQCLEREPGVKVPGFTYA
jgi:hypothetical protein